MIRRRWTSIIVLVMLLASLSSTEAAEVWTRVSVANTTPSNSGSARARYGPGDARHGAGRAHPQAMADQARTPSADPAWVTAADEETVMDIPSWTFWHAPVMPAPRSSCAVGVILIPFAHSIEMRGPPARPVQFATLSLRAPPPA